MALRGTDPESYITEYTLVYEDDKGSSLLQLAAALSESKSEATAVEPTIEATIVGQVYKP